MATNLFVIANVKQLRT